jgi:hypothetical protein
MKKILLRLTKSFAFEIFGAYECRLAISIINENKQFPSEASMRSKTAYVLLRALNKVYPIRRLVREQERSNIEQSQIYDEHLLSLMLNRIYDLPDITVDVSQPTRINVLVPAFTINTISAGFFGVFNVALYIAELGFNVRLVLFDNFYYVEDEFKASLKKFPSMEKLFDVLEVEYIGSRESPLKISPNDNAVATVWYSAYFAKKILDATNKKPFLYLIQDFEAAFYPFNSSYSAARNSYAFNYHTLCSSKSLLHFLTANEIIPSNRKAISFDNACSYSIFDKSAFFKNKSNSKKKFVFYSRPSVNRNMFELAALALIHAYKAGAFADEEWEFYGMGIGNVIVKINDKIEVKQLPRMSLAEYEETTKTFDLCLTLMSSPHPSLIPMDLAASGAIVVTNTFETKTAEYLNSISTNIIATEPELNSLIDAIFEAVRRTNDLESRYIGARVNWPKTWQETWNSNHSNFIREIFSNE